MSERPIVESGGGVIIVNTHSEGEEARSEETAIRASLPRFRLAITEQDVMLTGWKSGDVLTLFGLWLKVDQVDPNGVLTVTHQPDYNPLDNSDRSS